MKRQNKFLLVITMMFVLVFSTTYYTGSETQTASLINITDCSESFMTKYFDEMGKIDDEDKENTLIVTSKTRITNSYGATKVISAPNNQYMLVYDSETAKDNALNKLNKAKGIISVDENIIYEITAYNSWGVESTGMDDASAILEARAGAEDVVVAIIDTGLDVTLFKANYPNKLAGMYNALIGSTTTMSDENGHGTHIAGTIAESTPSNVKILPAKVTTGATLSSTDIINAINYIVYNEAADVINLSFGSYIPHTPTQQAILAATNNGIICVAAAGNDATPQTIYPAGYDETIAVSAVDSSNAIASFSNIGSNVEFAAPGVYINSINGIKSGTSMAAPHVAAAVAIVKSYNTEFTKTEVIDILKSNAVDLGTPGWDSQYGYGVISFIDFEYCTCNCDTCDSVACDGCTCVTCIHKDISLHVTKIEVSKLVLETYNYGSITNLANTELKIYYGSNYITKKLWELDDVTIAGYNPYQYTSQSIVISFGGRTVKVTLDARTEPESFWTYSVVSGSNIKLTGMKATPIVKLHLPTKIGNYTVTTIGEGLFKNSTLTKVTAPETITTIEAEAFALSTITELYSEAETLTVGTAAFSCAENLESVNSEIIFTGTDTFEECYSLTIARVSSSNTKIPYGTFYGCTNLGRITIPDNVTVIEDYAFSYTNLASVYIPAKVTSIGTYAFANCFNLNTVTLFEGLTTIKQGAFVTCTNIQSLSIPATVTSIEEQAFQSCTGLKTITVASGNTVYDSRNSCNALIETATNKIIIGTYNTTIPSTVTTIGEMAFAFNQLIYSVELPESVTTINANAFYGITNLLQVLTPKSLTTIGTDAFAYTPDFLVFWVYSTSYAKTYAETNNRHYRCYDPSSMVIYGTEDEYVAFETMPLDGVYFVWSYSDYDGTRTETINTGLQVKYQNGSTSFRATDTYVIIGATNSVGYYTEGKLEITVVKATPTYTIPTGLSAEAGQKLSEVELPTGFSWMTPTTVITGSGDKTYLATYTPTDTVNYNVVNNISITITVVPEREKITPTITIKDKVYDGTTSIDASTISVAELKSTEYTVVSATLASANVGEVNATVRIRLTDAKYKTATFPDKKQEYETTVKVNVTRATIAKPTAVNKVYTYNGSEQTFELSGFDATKMSVTGNKKTNAGEQMVTVKLTDNNYMWEDNTTTDIEFIFNINRAKIVYTASDSHYVADGKGYGITISVTSPKNAVIKYANASGEYTLDTMPTYSAIGTHTIKFKIYLDDNYDAVTDERKVYIYKEGIVSNTKDKEVIYDGLEHTLTMDINVGDVTITYSVGTEDYNLTTLPMFKDVGEYTVNYKIEKENFQTVYGSNKVKIYGVKKTDSTLRIDGNLLKIKNFNTSFSDITNRITIYGPQYNFEHLDINQNTKTENTVLTGEYISIFLTTSLGLNEFRYRMILLGDANCDGKISALDYVRIKNHIMKDPVITDELSLLSADANDDGKVSALDYVRIKNHIMDGGK